MLRLQVEGMKCEHCTRAVTEALAAVPGVTTVVEVSRERGEAVVQGSAAPTALVQAVQASGYRARVTTD